MKDGRSVTELAEEVHRRAIAKQDFLYPTSDLFISHDLQLRVENQGWFDIDQHTHRQIGSHFDIPTKYYDKMIEEAPDLLRANVNHWFDSVDETRMVRTLDDRARAYLSDRYRRLDNEDLLEAVIPAVNQAGAELVSCEVTDRKLYLKAIINDRQEEIGPPTEWTWGRGNDEIDVVNPGIVISNSEIGQGAVQVTPAIHTVRCSNLATFGQRGNLRKAHLGERLTTEGWEYFSKETQKISDAALWAQVSDYVHHALHGDLFQSIVNELREARNQPIEGDPIESVQVLSNEYALNQEETNGVMSHLLQGGDYSKYGLHAAVTETSAKVGDYDRASEMESIGAQIVNMPQQRWREVSKPPARRMLTNG